MKNSRRNFLKSITAAPLIVSACNKREYFYKEQNQNIINDKSSSVLSFCPLCNVCCDVKIQYMSNINKENEIYDNDSVIKRITPISNRSNNSICIKGFALKEVQYAKRQNKAEIEISVYESYKKWRESGDNIHINYNKIDEQLKQLRDDLLGYNSNKETKRNFVPIDIDEAIEIIIDKILYSYQKYGGKEIYSHSGNYLSIETQYAVNKFMRGLLSSQNISSDNDISLNSSAKAMKDTLGTYIPNTRSDDINHTDMLCVSGDNPRSSLAVQFWGYLDNLGKNNKKTLIIDPRRTASVIETEKQLFKINPSAKKVQYGYSFKIDDPNNNDDSKLFYISSINSDALIVNAITHHILTNYKESTDVNFINNYTENYPNFEKHILSNYSPESVETITGISKDLIKDIASEIARISIKAKSRGEGGIIWAVGNGVLSSFYGYETVKSIINLLAVTGNLTRKHSGLLPLYSKSNTIAPYISGNHKDIIISGLDKNEIFNDKQFNNWNFIQGYNNIHITDIISDIWNIDKNGLRKTIKTEGKTIANTIIRKELKEHSTILLFNSNLKKIPSYNELLKKELYKSFVISFDAYEDSCNREFADIILPSSLFDEREGHTIDLNRSLHYNNGVLNNVKNNTLIYYLKQISKLINIDTNPENPFTLISYVDDKLSDNEKLYKELSMITKGTECELPYNIKNRVQAVIPYRVSNRDNNDYRFLFGDRKERRRFFKSFRTQSGKIRLDNIPQRILTENDTQEIIDIVKVNYNLINFTKDGTKNIDKKTLTMIKDNGLLIRGVHSSYKQKDLSETKKENKYPLWLITGSVYEHSDINITNKSKMISDYLNKPYIEVSEKLAEIYSISEGEKIIIKTPAGKFYAYINIYSGNKIKPSRNIVPDYLIFAPYNILYPKDNNSNDKISVYDVMMPVIDPITGVFEHKTPCRLEYII